MFKKKMVTCCLVKQHWFFLFWCLLNIICYTMTKCLGKNCLVFPVSINFVYFFNTITVYNQESPKYFYILLLFKVTINTYHKCKLTSFHYYELCLYYIFTYNSILSYCFYFKCILFYLIANINIFYTCIYILDCMLLVRFIETSIFSIYIFVWHRKLNELTQIKGYC